MDQIKELKAVEFDRLTVCVSQIQARDHVEVKAVSANNCRDSRG